MTILEKMNQDAVGLVWDTGEPNSVKGLHLKIYATGRRCFYFRYFTKARLERRPKIGEGISLSKAREIAAKMKAEVLLGGDPKGDWDAARGEKTIQQAFDLIFKEYWDTPRFHESGRAKEVENIFKSKFGPIKNTRLSDLNLSGVRRWHQNMIETPTMANRALEVLNTIYKQSVEHEWCNRNPTILAKAFPEMKRKRVPTKEELYKILKSLFATARNTSDKDCQAAIYLIGLFYTGSRPILLTDLRWSHATVVTDKGIKFLLKGKMSYKTNREETVFIPNQVLELVNQFEHLHEGKVFSGKRTRQLWESLTREFNCGDLWKRDARKAFASLALSAGETMDQIGAALNHESANTTKVYAREFDNKTIDTTVKVAETIDSILLEDLF